MPQYPWRGGGILRLAECLAGTGLKFLVMPVLGRAPKTLQAIESFTNGQRRNTYFAPGSMNTESW